MTVLAFAPESRLSYRELFALDTSEIKVLDGFHCRDINLLLLLDFGSRSRAGISFYLVFRPGDVVGCVFNKLRLYSHHGQVAPANQRDEAIRAKDIAENKMRVKDFIGARKIVIKAQQLFPELENICQMLTVCEVHCSAETKVNGETDWYGILQVEPTADDIAIKKQYRKLALLLHPDKNKFVGAEAAFKLVGEAHRTLTDQGKRSLHDIKRRSNIMTVPIRQPAQQSNRPFPRKQPVVSNKTTNKSSAPFNGLNQQQPSQPPNTQTFWTICPFCGMRYQYYQNILNRALRCQNCAKPFVAYDLNANVMPSEASRGHSWNRTGIPRQEFRAPGAHVAGQKSYFVNAASAMGFQANVGGGATSSQRWPNSGLNAEVGDGSKNRATEDCKMDREVPTGNGVKFKKVGLQEANKREQVMKPGDGSENRATEDCKMDHEVPTGNGVKLKKVGLQEANKREQVVKPSAGNESRKRGRRFVVESSDTESSDSDVNIDSGHFAGQNIGITGSYPRRSTRQKQNISYNEDGDDDDFVSPSTKILKGGKTSNGYENVKSSFEGNSSGGDKLSSGIEKTEINCKGVVENSLDGLQEREHVTVGRENLNSAASPKANSSVGSSQKTTEDVEFLSYPDPEFFDFEKDREVCKFEVDQIWAVYDDLDGMPRFYARIKTVFGPDFKVQFNWLEYDPVSEDQINWSEKELPVGCGTFKVGKTQTSKEKPMFSHLMPWSKGNKRNTFKIYPRRGEIWAIYKDWDIEWSADADNPRIYEYEIVEVLSDFTEGTGVSIVNLVKINGFVCLFMRAIDGALLEIPPSDILRFSHKVPSYRMTGKERDNIPAGSFELDATSLPSNFAACFPSVSLDSSKGTTENLDNSGGQVKPTSAATKINSIQSNKSAYVKQRSRESSPNCLNGASKEDNVQASTEYHSASNVGKHVEILTESGESSIDCGEPSTDSETELDDGPSVSSPVTVYEYPDPEFFNFEQERSKEKFECGQIWALYSDIASYPNYYGKIRQVESGELFKVHVTWLEACSMRKEERRWLRELPMSCGIFKIAKEIVDYETTEAFSHIVQAVPDERGRYVIYPNPGEVWALYKNWNIEWSCSDMVACEYDVVEILKRTDSGIKVVDLTKVAGYTSVFMQERQGTTAGSIIEIPVSDYLKFSHKIPSFRLTEERGGKLRGYWELDPASVPQMLLIVDSD